MKIIVGTDKPWFIFSIHVLLFKYLRLSQRLLVLQKILSFFLILIIAIILLLTSPTFQMIHTSSYRSEVVHINWKF